MYNNLNEMNINEYISVISIVASYVGWKITGIGYSDSIVEKQILNECMSFAHYNL